LFSLQKQLQQREQQPGAISLSSSSSFCFFLFSFLSLFLSSGGSDAEVTFSENRREEDSEAARVD
jgi:hypothetical protein